MKTRQEEDAIASKLERALSDPLRAWVLAQLNDAPAAAVDLARKSGEPRNRISYHIGKLVEWDCAELIDTIKVRGTEKKIFAAKTRALITGEMWERMNLNSRNGISIKILNEGVERAQRALESGTFDNRLDRIAANYKPRLDEEGWQEAKALLHEVHQKFYEELEAKAVVRHPDPMDRRPFTFSMYLYESPSGR
jgi:hypothetical protein